MHPPTVIDRTTEHRWGPCMNALTHLQQNFVIAYVGRTPPNGTQAYADAGYTVKNDLVARVESHRLLHSDKVQAAIHEECQRRLKSLLPMAVATLERAMENPQAPVGDQIRAAVHVMDRGGLHAVTEHKSTVEHLGNDVEVLKRIQRLAVGLKMDPAKLLGARFKQIEAATDAEFVDGSAEGLEGLI